MWRYISIYGEYIYNAWAKWLDGTLRFLGDEGTIVKDNVIEWYGSAEDTVPVADGYYYATSDGSLLKGSFMYCEREGYRYFGEDGRAYRAAEVGEYYETVIGGTAYRFNCDGIAVDEDDVPLEKGTIE